MVITLAPGVVLPHKIEALTGELVSSGFTYGLGDKIVPLSCQWPNITSAPNAKQVDCSGDACWILYHLTAGGISLDPENMNSSDLHQWCEGQGFDTCEVADGHLRDSRLRMWFLTPEQGGGIGHVLFTCNGQTFESHGGKGPDSRPFGSEPFMHNMAGFALT